MFTHLYLLLNTYILHKIMNSNRLFTKEFPFSCSYCGTYFRCKAITLRTKFILSLIPEVITTAPTHK